jgi:hypothetical protein
MRRPRLTALLTGILASLAMLVDGSSTAAQRPRERPRQPPQIDEAVFSSDDKYVLLGHNYRRLVKSNREDRSISVFDVVAGKVAWTLTHDETLGAPLTFLPSGKQFLLVRDHDVEVRDANTGKRVRVAYSDETMRDRQVYPLPDGKRALVYREAGISLIDLDAGKVVRTYPDIRYGWLFVAPKGDYAVSVTSPEGDDRNVVRAWDLRSGKVLLALSGVYHWSGCKSISPDGALLGVEQHDVESNEDHLVLFAMPAGRPVKRVIPSPGGRLLADGTGFVAAGSGPSYVEYWTLSGKLTRSVELGAWSDLVEVSPDGTLAFRVTSLPDSWDQRLQLWDLASEEVVHDVVLRRQP